MVEYSFIVPIYNDADLAPAFCASFQTAFRSLLGVDDIVAKVELIFVSDGSREEDFEKLRQVAHSYPFVRLIELSRNFGQHVAVSAGYANASGSYVGTMNVDMEDSPDQIPIVLTKMKENQWDFACGIYEVRHIPLMQKVTSVLFNVTMGFLTGYSLAYRSATLRIMNRAFLLAYLQLSEKSRFLPALECWLGFRRGYVPVRHQPRGTGRSSYNLRRRLSMALESVITFSDIPLRFAALGGLAIALIGFALIGILIFHKLFSIDFRPGYTSTIAATVFLGGLNILTIGLASLYIGKILKEVQNRPLYIIRQKVNFVGI